MNKLEYLYEFAAENSICIVNDTFSKTKKAACIHLKPDKLIVLDIAAIESKAEETVLLAEECGHYETGSLYIIEATYNTAVARSNRIKYEAMAKRWTYKNFLKPDEIETAFRLEGSFGEDAVAAHCGVPVDFLRKAVEYYRSTGVVFSFECNADSCA